MNIIRGLKRIRELREMESWRQPLRLPSPHDSVKVQLRLQRLWAEAARRDRRSS